MQRVGGYRIAYGIRMQHIPAPSIMLYYYIKERRGVEGAARGSFGPLARRISVADNPRLFEKGEWSVGLCTILGECLWDLQHSVGTAPLNCIS
jgi:hypothetical protein